MKCQQFCGAEMIRMVSMKRAYGSNIHVCPNLKEHKIDLQKSGFDTVQKVKKNEQILFAKHFHK